MAFKKILKSGQASMEYFILFATIGAIVFLGLSTDKGSFLSKVRDAMQGDTGFFQKAAKNIIQSDFYSNTGGGGGGGGGGNCLVKGTKISLADGSSRPIEEIKKGDMVLGYDGKSVQTGKVIKTFFHPNKRGYRIITTEDGQQIKITGNHRVFQGKIYQAARRFKVGDALFLLRDNKLQAVKIKTVEVRKERVDLYNLAVARLHNFFAEGVLCHNSKDPGD